MKVLARWVLSEGPGENPFLASSSFCWRRALLGSWPCKRKLIIDCLRIKIIDLSKRSYGQGDRLMY